jgi:cytochrome c553
LQFTRAQVSDRFGPADWFPQDHPEMPPIVAHGKASNVIACALCHYPNGRGRPENAAIAGLPEVYILEQLTHFRHDERNTADPRKTNTNLMVQIAKGMTDAEMESAARYYSSQKFPRWIKVVETDTVPKTVSAGGMFLTIPNGGGEPIGNRIIETPENREAVEELRNPRVGFIAYVPRGSIRKGKAIVTRGGSKTALPCTTCHGPDLKGMQNIPPIAGRSPSYIVREMFDIKAGTRFGPGVEVMKPIVAQLNDDDLLNVAAYVSSLSP